MRERLNITAEDIVEAILESEMSEWFEEFGIPESDVEKEIELILERLGFEGGL